MSKGAAISVVAGALLVIFTNARLVFCYGSTTLVNKPAISTFIALSSFVEWTYGLFGIVTRLLIAPAPTLLLSKVSFEFWVER